MSLNGAIFICLLANLLFSYRGYEAASVLPQSTILNTMLKDKNICDNYKNILHSKYLKKCSELNFPTKLVNVTHENVDEFLCLALYDNYINICQYYKNKNNNTKDKNINEMSVLNNQTLFDKKIAEITEKNDIEAFNICRAIINSTAVYNATLPYVSQLKSDFYEAYTCMQKCETKPRSKTINPLCIALGIIDLDLYKKLQKENEKKIDPQSTVPPNLKTKDSELKTHVTEDKTTQLSGEIKIDSTSNPSGDKNPPGEEKNKSESKEKNVKPNVPLEVSHDDVKSKPVKIDSVEDKQTVVSNSEKIVLTLAPAPEKQDEAADTKTTISEQTRNDDIDERLEYDNEQLKDPGEDLDDPLKSLSKDNTLLDGDLIDQNEHEPRRPIIQEEDDSHFFGYFTIIGLIGIGGCLIYHRKQKILAMIVEGRRSRSGRGRKRPSTASYRKLDSNLEEAVTSQCSSNVSHVIY